MVPQWGPCGEKHSLSRSLLYLFLGVTGKEHPLQVPQHVPYGERCPFPEPCFIYLRAPPPWSPTGAHMERDVTFPEPMVYLSIRSFILMSQRPQLRSSPTKWGTHMVTVHGSPCTWKAYIQWGAACFHKVIVDNTAVIAATARRPSA